MDFVQTKAKVISDATGVSDEIPVLLTSAGVVEPLVDFVLSHSHDRSTTWMNNVVRAARLFLQFSQANFIAVSNPEELFRQFVLRLSSGTIGTTGLDPSGLYWLPTSPQTSRMLVGCLTELSAWLENNRSAINLNPPRVASPHERALDSLANEYRRNKAFLSHILRETDTSTTTSMRAQRSPKVDEELAIAFPEEHFARLITTGFSCAGVVNLRDVLITLLMHGAGFRTSECFHLWVHDVVEDPSDPTVALVRIHHPRFGTAPMDWLNERGQPRHCNREAYLRGRYGLAPRDKVLGSMAAGWKNPMLDGKYFMRAHWFPQEYGRIFLSLWRIYLRQLAVVERHHPYAFVSLSGPTSGGAYSIDAYQEAHRRAVNRCGLLVAKDEGTTPHGHRHSFGHRATVVDGVEVFEGARLTDSERRALEKAVSAAFLQGEGWTEGPHGEIRNARGRNVFDVGFSTAIRKVVVSKGAAQ